MGYPTGGGGQWGLTSPALAPPSDPLCTSLGGMCSSTFPDPQGMNRGILTQAPYKWGREQYRSKGQTKADMRTPKGPPPLTGFTFSAKARLRFWLAIPPAASHHHTRDATPSSRHTSLLRFASRRIPPLSSCPVPAPEGSGFLSAGATKLPPRG